MRLFTRTATALLSIAWLFLPWPAAQAQTFKVLYSFVGGGQPSAGVILDAAGNLYGTTTGAGEGAGAVFELSPGSGGWTESILHAFTGGSDGGIPFDALVFDVTGNLYGTTNMGGISCGHNGGCGVVFELTPNHGGWTETVLYSFQGGEGGYYPIAGVVPDAQGNLYSTIENGGSAQGGVVYELTEGTGGWQEDILYSFNGNTTGVAPAAAPILDAAGNLYGTTACCSSGGAVWELVHGSWKEKTLYSFSSGGGDNSEASLVFDKAGNLYGTTTQGGGKNQAGKGVVFKLAKSRGGKWKETVLHIFKGGTDGNEPVGAPVFDKSGNLYGTTMHGGIASCDNGSGCGTVFKLTLAKDGRWKETILHRFTGGSDGAYPYFVQLAIDPAGNLYGTTVGGGNGGCGNIGCGVVFEITP
jgi:uncharacterized repeat protein (TIGR03803 family)